MASKHTRYLQQYSGGSRQSAEPLGPASWILHLPLSALVTKSPAHPSLMSCHCSLPDPHADPAAANRSSVGGISGTSSSPFPCSLLCPLLPTLLSLLCLLWAPSAGFGAVSSHQLSFVLAVGEMCSRFASKDPSTPLFVDQPGCRRGAKQLALSKQRALIKALQ